MTRVSENSSTSAINFGLSKVKRRLEDMHLSGASLKRINKPSDDPSGSVELLSIRSENIDLKQYARNINFAKTHLVFTETAIEDLSEVMGKAKEIAIGQASDIYNPEVRKSVAKEVNQLRKQAIAIANRRLGNKYIFAGYNTLQTPFNEKGEYAGDGGSIHLEITKDYFVPINLTGRQVFFAAGEKEEGKRDPLSGKELNQQIRDSEHIENAETAKRDLASVHDPAPKDNEKSIFKELEILENALMTNDPDLVQGLLKTLDDSHNRLVTLRTRVGAIHNAVLSAETNLDKTHLMNETHKSKIEDVDVAELFTDISKQQNILKATYKAGATSLNRTLLDFLR